LNVKVTANPAGELPGSVLGAPIRIPSVLLCTNGENWCGRVWVANHRRQLPERLAERRDHEARCRGGLVLSGR